MPTVILSDESDALLKRLVTDPFEQTRESLVDDLIRAEVQRRGIAAAGNGYPAALDDLIRLEPDSHGSLVHTRVLSASVAGRELHRPKWNGLREHVHLIALKHFGSFDALQEASGARLRAGRHEKEGFKYLPDGDFSIQGVDANLSWDHALGLARAMSIPIRAMFEWREKEGASHPGRKGVLEWKPVKSRA